MTKLIHKSATFLAYLAGVALYLTVTVTFVNVLLYSLNRITSLLDYQVNSIKGYEEFVTLSVLVAALFMLPYCQLKYGHIRLTFIVAKLPKKIKSALDCLWLTILAMLVVFFLYQMVFGMLDSFSDNIILSVLNWPEWPFFIAGLISLFIWFLVLLLQIYVSVKFLIKPNHRNTESHNYYE